MSEVISVLQLDDDKGIRADFRKTFPAVTQGMNVNLSQTETLEEFLNRLRENSAFSRFILDGKFPNTLGGVIDFHLPDALSLIAELKRQIDRIVIYSAEDMDKLRGSIPEAIPAEKVIIFQKGTSSSVRGVLEAAIS